MRNAVIGRMDKMDRSSVSDGTLLLSPEEWRVRSAEVKPDYLFIPLESAGDYIGKKNVNVYFDLELYPFFQRVKEVISADGDAKGVLRLRRTIPKNGSESDLYGDLFALSAIAGEPEQICVRSTNRENIPYHLILMIRFSGGKMAHAEYTFGAGEERIEVEWSGIKTIAEFDSEEMTPIKPHGHTRLPLVYSVDDILEKSHRTDEAFYEKLETYKTLLGGGGNL
ncbi:hypothetical protein [Bacillus sp. Marseille-Q1617]|uniref:hypothetical protein n=1 Tax=Bacillus sp. Marseille-Q1617 TaxID=2736887 RepID=UPI00158D4CF4|nr:hypothetical protein [Bacillus sp. Marseille-Q1617]